MHEASIAGEIVRTAAAKVPPGARALKVLVRVGRLTSISPDALRFYFEVLREDLLGVQAELDVSVSPLRGRCASCCRVVESDEPIWRCPTCGSPTLTFENGDELDFAGLVVDDGTADHDRTEDPQEEWGDRARKSPVH